MNDFLEKIWASLPAAIVVGILGVLRLVFTNHKRLDMMEQDIKQDREHRESERKRDREDLKEIKDNVKILTEKALK